MNIRFLAGVAILAAVPALISAGPVIQLRRNFTGAAPNSAVVPLRLEISENTQSIAYMRVRVRWRTADTEGVVEFTPNPPDSWGEGGGVGKNFIPALSLAPSVSGANSFRAFEAGELAPGDFSSGLVCNIGINSGEEPFTVTLEADADNDIILNNDFEEIPDVRFRGFHVTPFVDPMEASVGYLLGLKVVVPPAFADGNFDTKIDAGDVVQSAPQQ